MGESMSANSSKAPPRFLQDFVGVFLPPSCREQVLGDLEEQYRAAPPIRALPRYLFEAAAVVPAVQFTQWRRFFVGCGVPLPLEIHSGAAVVRQRIEKFQHETYCRFLFYLSMMSLISAWLAWRIVWAESWPARLIPAALIAAFQYTVYQHYTRSPSRAVPANVSLSLLIAFYRRQLALQRDFLRTLWYWKMLPIAAPILLLLLVKPSWRVAGTALWMAGGFALSNLAARKQARGLQKRIDELSDQGHSQDAGGSS
jgi:hypothetical protein